MNPTPAQIDHWIRKYYNEAFREIPLYDLAYAAHRISKR